ncbi:MAG: hypothetical protein U9O98_00735 [Asgard group archaeon]|nr:hypothetical protein [Asgard group archaeon]
MLDEVLVIRESIPLFYYNSDPTVALSDNFYVLQSGFFVALSQFANEMSHDRLKYIILENKLYALDEVSEIMLIFGNNEHMTEDILKEMENQLIKATNYMNYLLEKYNLEKFLPTAEMLNELSNDFGEYLKQEELVEDDKPFDPYESRSLMQKFIFNAIGYKPGQCNIGPAERFKRLLTGLIGFLFGIAGALVIILLDVSAWYTLILLVPIFIGFYGLYQYFFRFCVANGLRKKYDMR